MQTLSELQHEFVNVITQSSASQYLTTTKHRIAIYQNNYLYNLVAVLKAHYPVCLRLVGDAYFKKCAQEYVFAYPSTNADLNNYGSEFSSFLKQLNTLAYLSDVAALEWAWQCAYVGSDWQYTAFSEIASIAPESQGDICFELVSNGHLLRSDYPISTIWAANQTDIAEKDIPIIDLTSGSEFLFVWRRYWDVSIESMSESEWQLLSQLFNGLTLKELGSDASILIPQWIQKGWLTGFTIKQ